MAEDIAPEVLSEYDAIRRRVGWCRLRAESPFEISGKDAVSFLHGMVSNDVKSLKEGGGCYATCLTATGKMISDLRIFALPDRLWILLPSLQKGKVLEYLENFVFIEEVSFKDLEEEIDIFSLQGPSSERFLADLIGETFAWEAHRHGAFEIEGILSRILCATHTGERGFDILISRKESGHFCEVLLKKRGPHPIHELHEEALEILRIEAALPRYGVDMDDSTIPLEVGLNQAISFTKGCYVGQEVIARIHHIGHVNRHWVGLKLSGPTSRGGAVIFDGNEVGKVTSTCYSPFLNSYVALALIRRDMAEVGKPLEVKGPKNIQSAIIVPLPFYGSA